MNAHTKPDPWAKFAADIDALADRTAQLLVDEDEAAVSRGARELIARPWLADRIVRGASSLTLGQLAVSVLRRPTRPLKVRQLERALKDPAFGAAWNAYREGIAA